MRMFHSPPDGQRGFSLVELAIVLVIVGLLAGGILTGRSLMRAAEIRGMVSEYERYRTAMFAFRDKYFGLPGDIPNAFQFWGAATGCTDAISNTDLNGCNGDGDGRITENGPYTGGERYRAWQHLALAGLVEGDYSGVKNNLPDEGISRIPGGKWRLRYYGSNGHGWVNQTTVQDGNQFALGGDSTVNGSHRLDSSEAWNIDSKIDDGLPGLGRFFVHGTLNIDCITATMVGTRPDALTARYNLENKQRSCEFIAML